MKQAYRTAFSYSALVVSAASFFVSAYLVASYLPKHMRNTAPAVSASIPEKYGAGNLLETITQRTVQQTPQEVQPQRTQVYFPDGYDIGLIKARVLNEADQLRKEGASEKEIQELIEKNTASHVENLRVIDSMVEEIFREKRI